MIKKYINYLKEDIDICEIDNRNLSNNKKYKERIKNQLDNVNESRNELDPYGEEQWEDDYIGDDTQIRRQFDQLRTSINDLINIYNERYDKNLTMEFIEVNQGGYGSMCLKISLNGRVVMSIDHIPQHFYVAISAKTISMGRYYSLRHMNYYMFLQVIPVVRRKLREIIEHN